jgi:RNA polymerase sigma-70 factor, ECF subfamily
MSTFRLRELHVPVSILLKEIHNNSDKKVRRRRLDRCNRVNSGSKNEWPGESDWEQWLARHSPALLLFARQQARREADAQDLVQEAVVESWQRQSNGAPPPLGLVYATIRRRAIDLARRDGRRAGREEAAHRDGPQCWFDADPDERERSRLIGKAMCELSEIHRDVVTLKVWGGLTFSEIAEALDIPANTAAARYRYGLIELRKLTKETLA